ncbi:MAG TPA: hypothetical protein VG407_04765 [Caulobacteraceae bacterium]|jgi:hypothetical protein|nr:hypothetical protein [Caulobacteraceae bacterium]
MRTSIAVCAVLVAAAALSGCKKKADGSFEFGGLQHQKGRYEGVGVYSPASAWARLNDAQQANGAPMTSNDQAIIVVVDSDTGEMRACGDLSGYCVGMNPWNKDLVPAQRTPVKVTPGLSTDTQADDTPPAKSAAHK